MVDSRIVILSVDRISSIIVDKIFDTIVDMIFCLHRLGLVIHRLRPWKHGLRKQPTGNSGSNPPATASLSAMVVRRKKKERKKERN